MGIVWGLVPETKKKTKSVLFSWTLYTTATIDYQWSPSSKITSGSLTWSWQLPALSLSPLWCRCRCPCCGSCVARWSQGGFAVLLIRLMGSEWRVWAAARALGHRATLGSPGWGCPAGICSGTFLCGSQTRPTVLSGVVARLIWAGWHSGYVVPLPHLDSDSSVYLGISRSLMNDLEIKLKQNQPKRFYCLKRFIGGNFKAFFFRWCCVWQADKWIMLINCYKVSLSFSLFLSLSLSSVHD